MVLCTNDMTSLHACRGHMLLNSSGVAQLKEAAVQGSKLSVTVRVDGSGEGVSEQRAKGRVGRRFRTYLSTDLEGAILIIVRHSKGSL